MEFLMSDIFCFWVDVEYERIKNHTPAMLSRLADAEQEAIDDMDDCV